MAATQLRPQPLHSSAGFHFHLPRRKPRRDVLPKFPAATGRQRPAPHLLAYSPRGPRHARTPRQSSPARRQRCPGDGNKHNGNNGSLWHTYQWLLQSCPSSLYKTALGQLCRVSTRTLPTPGEHAGAQLTSAPHPRRAATCALTTAQHPPRPACRP